MNSLWMPQRGIVHILEKEVMQVLRWWGQLVTFVMMVVMTTKSVASQGATQVMWGITFENERYWFTDGERRMLWHGVNCVLPVDHSEGVRYDVRAAHGHDMARWATATWERLTNWGFNAIGAWSAEEIYALGVPHTRCAWLGGWGAAALVDVFSEEYRRRFDETVQRDIVPYAEERGLLGFFCNNEMAWYGEFGWPTDPGKALLYQYMALPSNAAGKRAVVEFLRSQANNAVTQFNREWEPGVASFEELYERTQVRPRTRRAKQQIYDWAGVVAEKYFSMVREALGKHAPKKLFLGARFAGTAPRAVIEACGRYADVVSLNLYRKDGSVDTRFLDNVYALTRKPLLITEFSWRATQNASGNRNTRGADVTVATQVERARCAERFCTALAGLPYVVGWDWFQYFDQPPGGRFDGEDSNYGLVSIHDQPYEVLIETLRRVHQRAAELHAASAHSLPREFNVAAWPELRPVRVPERAAGARMMPILLWWRLPANMRVDTWGDDHAGARIAVQVVSNQLEVRAQPAGWGCGCTLPAMGVRRSRQGSLNVYGARYVGVRAMISRGMTVQLVLNESGAGPVGAQTYAGERGADGETYLTMPLRGTGGWEVYVIDLAECELNTSYGNQRGNATLDTQAILSVGILFPGSQPAGELQIRAVGFAATAEEARCVVSEEGGHSGFSAKIAKRRDGSQI